MTCPSSPTRSASARSPATSAASVWYLCYHEHGQRRRPRVGPDREAARQLAAQINAQLEVGAPAALSFEPIAIPDLRDALARAPRAGPALVGPDRSTATAPPPTTCSASSSSGPVRHASQFHASHAEEFVRYLRDAAGLAERARQHAQAAADGQGGALRPGVLPGPVQLRRQAAAPVALRREPVRRAGDRPHPRRAGPADRAVHRRSRSGPSSRRATTGSSRCS